MANDREVEARLEALEKKLKVSGAPQEDTKKFDALESRVEALEEKATKPVK